MGSTIVLVLIKDGMVHYASLGDSRIYLVREGSIKQLTKDHSLVQKMVDSNLITEDEAKEHPQKNVITKALGTNENAEPEFYESFMLTVSDILVLCSDGLNAHVDEKEILEVVENNTAQDSANTLVELANERGGRDNITVQVISAEEGSKSNNNVNKINKYLLYTILTISLATLVYLLFAFEIIRFGDKERKPITIEKSSNPAELGNNNQKKSGRTSDSSGVLNQSIVNQDSLINNSEEETLNEEDSIQ